MTNALDSSSDRSHVAIAACPSYSAGDMARALSEVMEAVGGLTSLIQPGQTVLLKPNLFSPHAPADAVTTHPELVRQVIQLCAKAGAARIWVGDSPVGVHSEKELWLRTGMVAAIAGTTAELKSWHVKQTPLNCNDDILAIPEWYSQVDVVISLPKLKTHCLTTMTCGLKNVYGIVSGLAKAQFHTKYSSPLTMSSFLVHVFSALKPHLTIADAVVAMEGNGPAHGRPLSVGVLLASRDAVALDAIGCASLRISPAAVPMIRLAAERKLGIMDESRIDCSGSGVALLRSARLKPSLARYLTRLPEWAFGSGIRLLRMRPQVQLKQCLKCGMCAKACPRGAIAGEASVDFPTIDYLKCIDCFCCIESCPENAIAVGYCLGNHFCIARQKHSKADSA